MPRACESFIFAENVHIGPLPSEENSESMWSFPSGMNLVVIACISIYSSSDAERAWRLRSLKRVAP